MTPEFDIQIERLAASSSSARQRFEERFRTAVNTSRLVSPTSLPSAGPSVPVAPMNQRPSSNHPVGGIDSELPATTRDFSSDAVPTLGGFERFISAVKRGLRWLLFWRHR
jgi:hypothetical protein